MHTTLGMGHDGQVVFFWVHIARRLMTDFEREDRINSARSDRNKGSEGGASSGTNPPDSALSERQKKQIDFAFHLFDDDDDGRIDSNELKARKIHLSL